MARITPAERRFQSVTASHRGSDTPVAPQQAENLYEQMLMQLAEHRRVLKTVQSLARKLQAKAQFLPQYDAYISGVLASNSGVQDEVFVTILLWHIDVGNIAQALPLAEYALNHKLVMPDRFERGLACTIAEEIAETAARLHNSENAVSSSLLQQTAELTADHDMYDEARAKLYKALGQALEAEGSAADAIAAYEKALALHDKIGVKKFIEKLQRDLKNAQNQTTGDSAQNADQQTDQQATDAG